MTREETVKWLESLKSEIGKLEHRSLWHYAEAIDMAIEALKAESSTEGRYEKAIKTLQEMPKYINSNTIGKKLKVFNHTREEQGDKTRKA